MLLPFKLKIMIFSSTTPEQLKAAIIAITHVNHIEVSKLADDKNNVDSDDPNVVVFQIRSSMGIELNSILQLGIAVYNPRFAVNTATNKLMITFVVPVLN